jgi:hypothetical protein
MSRQRSNVNEGIQANNVTADVLAVGRGAKAVKTVHGNTDTEKLLAAMSAVRAQLDNLPLTKPQRDAVEQHAQDFERIAASKPANSPETQGAFAKFMEKLKDVGIAVKETADLVAPIKTIAGLVHLSLVAFGL